MNRKVLFFLGFVIGNIYTSEDIPGGYLQQGVLDRIMNDFDSSPARVAAIERYLKHDSPARMHLMSRMEGVRAPLFTDLSLSLHEQDSLSAVDVSEQVAIITALALQLFDDPTLDTVQPQEPLSLANKNIQNEDTRLVEDQSEIKEENDDSAITKKAKVSQEVKPKRQYERQEPKREEYSSEKAFKSAWKIWRAFRDKNNKAVRKSRDHKDI